MRIPPCWSSLRILLVLLALVLLPDHQLVKALPSEQLVVEGYATQLIYDEAGKELYREIFGQDSNPRVQEGWRFWIAEIVLINPSVNSVQLDLPNERTTVPLQDTGGYSRQATVYIYWESGFRPMILPAAAIRLYAYGEISTIHDPSNLSISTRSGEIILVDLENVRSAPQFPVPEYLSPHVSLPRTIDLPDSAGTLIIEPLKPVSNEDGDIFLQFRITIENMSGFNIRAGQVSIVAIDGNGDYYGNTDDDHLDLSIVPGELKSYELTVKRGHQYLLTMGHNYQDATSIVQRILIGIFYRPDPVENSYRIMGYGYIDLLSIAVESSSVLDQQSVAEIFYEQEERAVLAVIRDASEAMIQSFLNNDQAYWDEVFTQDAIYYDYIGGRTLSRSDISGCEGVYLTQMNTLSDLVTRPTVVREESRIIDLNHAELRLIQAYNQVRFICGQADSLETEGPTRAFLASTYEFCYTVEKIDQRWFISSMATCR